MEDVFFTATKRALKNITNTFDTVWPIAVGLWNLRCAVKGVKDEWPLITEKQLADKFTAGSGIHGVNYKKTVMTQSWEEQLNGLSWMLLNSTIPIYEEWIKELNGDIYNGTIDEKKLQFPNNIEREIARLQGNASQIMKDAFYQTYCIKRDRNYGNIKVMMMCYRAFKEARNCYMHNGMIADQKTVDAYNAYITNATLQNLEIKELPLFKRNPILGEKIELNLRSVVGFSYVVIKILVSLDSELVCTKQAETEFRKRWEQKNGKVKRTLKGDHEKVKIQAMQYVKQCRFPKPANPEDMVKYLLQERFVMR